MGNQSASIREPANKSNKESQLSKMAPNATASMSSPTMTLTEERITASPDGNKSDKKEYRREIVWGNVFKFAVLHVLSLHALVLLPSVTAKTMAFSLLCFLLGGLGVTAGAHRLWTHRSYKARLPLRVFLMLVNCLAM